MNPFRPIIKVNPNQEPDIDERESNNDEEESTTSTQMSAQNSTSDIPTEATEESKPSVISQVHTVPHKSTQDEADSTTVKHVTEFDLPTKENGGLNIGKENKLRSNNFEVKFKTEKLKSS